jgi:acetyl-CoA decarbonylase/synthase complex subunit beta
MPGFNGVSYQYIVSPKYQQYDAQALNVESGIHTIVWMPKAVKERVIDFIPEDLAPKIATEEEVQDINQLKAWLKENDHPIVATWAAMEAEEEAEEEWEEEGAMVPMGTIGMTIPGVGGSGGFKVILKNCKVHAESIIIKKIEPRHKKK